MNRREMLRAAAVAGAAAALPWPSFSQSWPAADWRRDVIRYLESLARGDGGYGWEGQDHSHLTPTFYVIGSYRLVGKTPPQTKQLAEFIRTHHPGALKKLDQERRAFDFQQVQTLAWLGEDASALKEKILAWRKPLAYLKQYERHGYPLFSSETGVILARALLGVPASELPSEFAAYLDSRRRANGSFNNTPATDGSDGHVMSTWWGLQALRVLERDQEKRDEMIAWLRDCQLPNGGFTFQPKPEFGGVEDVAYTRAAVRALQQLGESPKDSRKCVAWLHSLANSDGGFADRPGWLSNPMATYYALDALEALGGFESLAEVKRRAPATKRSLSAGLKVFSIQLEAHGQGSPMEAVELARSLRIHLWGAKNAKPNWLARAQNIADQQKVPVKFFVANEEYGTWVNVPGFGTYSHTSDIIAPAGANIGPSLASQGAVSWGEFRERRLKPLRQGDGRLIWQFGENEELVRIFLDDSVERGGYAAISTYHFGNPDFTNSEPFLHRWRGRIPFVALQDAHGPEPWWFADMTTGFRTLFLAREATWEGWLNALTNNWVVAVRQDEWSGGKTWMHGGSNEVLEFVRARERDWRWWDNREIQRPLVSIVVVRPEDEFEVARPDTGVTLRIRCAWENTPQGLLRQPITEFVKLSLDGREMMPTLVSKKRPSGTLLNDHYHELQLRELKPGKHTATVVVRVIATGEQLSRTLSFSG
ncbi:MAG: terpene cyclase/mutase family protein [Verrucomicrobia bacterium]|nr:terpene cyclase/mutase family protein [Verrucomicrobiota bacterium]